MTCRITIHMVSSVDGFIAKRDKSMSWFDTSSAYDKGVPLENPEESLKDIDCYVMGSHTFELAEELSVDSGWAYEGKPCFVFTSRDLKSKFPNVSFCSGDFLPFVEEQLKGKYQNVWVVGGATLVNEFLNQKLADELRLSILPILLGDGLAFFKNDRLEQSLELLDSKAYNNGILDLRYAILK